MKRVLFFRRIPPFVFVANTKNEGKTVTMGQQLFVYSKNEMKC
jgi:hypothetical protein